MSGDKPEVVSVTGGAGGSDATYDDIVDLASLFETAGDELRSNAWDDKGLLANGDLLQSALLSSRTFAEAEAAVITATIGPHGVASRAICIEADALIMTTSVGAYRLADDVVHGLYESLSYVGGFTLGLVTPGLVLLGGGLGAASLLTNPLVMAYVATHPALKDQILADVQRFIEDHPELVQELVNSGGGLLDGLVDSPLLPVPYGLRGPLLATLGIDPVHGTTGDAAGDLAGMFGDTGQEVTANGTDVRHLPPPGSLEDLMAGLSTTNNGGDGEIDIQLVGNPPHYIVNLPGTDSWDDPGDARDLTANLQLVGAQDTAYSRGILEAMDRAGIPKDAPVMLVGHSQGGMTAVHLAADPDFQERFNVRHVVTAGAPTAQVPDIPSGTHVFSLENTGDVVPLLDGEDNPDAANRTTVRFDGTTGSVGGNHDMGVYTRAGAVVDSYDDPSTRAALQQMRDDGFLGDGRGPSSTETYTITRKP